MRIHFGTFTLFFLLFFVPVNLISQNYNNPDYKLKSYNYSNIYKKKVFLDTDGFLWYSTYNGIVTERGGHFKFYSYNLPHVKKAREVFKIFQLPNGDICEISRDGLIILNKLSGELKRIKPDVGCGKWWWEGEKTFYDSDSWYYMFTSTLIDENGILWLGTNRNYIYAINKDFQISTYHLPDIPLVDRNDGIILKEVLDETLIFESNGRLYSFVNGKSIKLNKFNPYLNDKGSLHLTNNTSFFNSRSYGNFIINKRLFYFEYLPSINRYVIYSPLLNTLLHSDSKDSLDFLFSDEFDFKYYRVTNEANKYKIQELQKERFKSPIHDFILDPFSNLWLITEDGIFRRQIQNGYFNTYLVSNDRERIICRGLSKNKDEELYLYTHSGFYKRNRFKKFERISFTFEKTDVPLPDFIYDFYFLNNSTILAYGYGEYILSINLKTKKIRQYIFPLLSNKLDWNNNFVLDIEPIDSTNLLIGGSYGLQELNTKTKTLKVKNQLNDFISIEDKQVHDIYINKDRSALWIGMDKGLGLYRKDLKTNEVIHYSSQNIDYPLIGNTVRQIYEDDANNIWISTNSGLQKISASANSDITITKENGLLSNNIVGVLQHKDYLWISTYNGLSRYNMNTYTIENFTEEDGLPHNEFNVKSLFKENDSTYYFGGLNGLIMFNPNKIESKVKRPLLKLTEIEKFDENTNDIRSQDYFYNNNSFFNLKNNQNYIKLTFCINDLAGVNKNKYYYKIPEINSNWNDFGGNNYIQIQGLEPKKYTLLVKGINSDGSETNTLKYTIDIDQIFYKKRLFLASLFLLFALAGVIIVFSRIKTIKTRFENKNKLIELSQRALLSRMNPHFVSNIMNGIQSVMLTKGEIEASKYISTFSRLLRLTLDMNNSNFSSLKKEILYISSYLEIEKIRLDGKLTVELEVDKTIDQEKVRIPNMLVQPIIENAIIHGLAPKKNNRKISILIKKEPPWIEIVIQDNGIGRKNSMKNKKKVGVSHKSWGTTIMNERISLFNNSNKIDIMFEIFDLEENEVSLGTKVILKIPFENN